MKQKKPLTLETQLRLVRKVEEAANALVDYQFRLHPVVQEKAVGLQVEAARARFTVTQLIAGTYEPPPPAGRKGRR